MLGRIVQGSSRSSSCSFKRPYDLGSPFRMAAPAPDHTRSLEDDVPIPASDALRRRIEAEMDEDDADDALLELSEPPPPASASFRTQS